MKIDLVDIPDLQLSPTCKWRIRALSVNGKMPAIEALAEWESIRLADYKRIVKVMKIVSEKLRVTDQRHVKKTEKTHLYGDVYEMRSHTGKARLMFFYDNRNESVVVCTNPYVKGKGNQDAAFKLCSQLKEIYEANT